MRSEPPAISVRRSRGPAAHKGAGMQAHRVSRSPTYVMCGVVLVCSPLPALIHFPGDAFASTTPLIDADASAAGLVSGASVSGDSTVSSEAGDQ